MAKVLVSETNLMNIAEAIRGKTGETAKMKPAEMAGKIEGIQTGEDNFKMFCEGTDLGDFTSYCKRIGPYKFHYYVAENKYFTGNLNFPELEEIGSNSFYALTDTQDRMYRFTGFKAPKLKKLTNGNFYCISFQNLHIENIERIDGGALENCRILDDTFNIPKCRLLVYSSLKNTRGFRKFICGTDVEDAVIKKSSLPNSGLGRLNQFSDKGSPLEIVDIKTYRFYPGDFAYNTKMKTLIIRRADEVTQLDDVNAFTSTLIESGEGSIYVPDNLLEDYKVATNWSVFADQIKPLSEYTEV